MPPLSEGEGATISAYECVCGTTRQRMKECSCEPPRAQRYRSAVQLLSQRGQRYCPKGQRKKRLLVTNVTEDQVRLARSKDIGNGNGQAPDYVTDRGLRHLTPPLNSPQFACLDCILSLRLVLAPDHVARFAPWLRQ